jgi:general secretion pathway protein A
MDYFKILNFEKEPFSNSPDPDFFYHSKQHVECMQKVELSIRLRRGLSVVIGDVGTGKTTICRQLIRKLAGDAKLETHLLLDPYFSTPHEFLAALAELLTKEIPGPGATDWQLTEAVKRHLYQRGVEEGKVVVIIIDEGQKIPDFCLEILRELLNYETNTFKLLQIVIFAQLEFRDFLDAHPNFADRINMRHDLAHLGFRETRALIRFRIETAGGLTKGGVSFSLPALWTVYKATRGYPRKIINLCHRLILNLIVQNRTRVTRRAVRSCTRAVFPKTASGWKRRTALVAASLAAAFTTGVVTPSFLARMENRYGGGTVVASRILLPPPPPERYSLPPPQNPSPGIQVPDAQASLPPQGADQAGLILAVPPKEPVTPRPEIGSGTWGREVQGEAPRFLGEVAAARGDYLRAMARTIYGRDDSEVVDALIRANETIRNPNLIEVGRVIRFPAVKASPSGRERNACRVELARMTDLQHAYRFATEQSTQGTPIRMIPCWSKKDRLQFVLVLAMPFKDEYAAKEEMRRLPEPLASRAVVLAKWEAGTIFFADF